MSVTVLIVSIAFLLGALGILASSKLKLPSILFYLVIGILAGLIVGTNGLNLFSTENFSGMVTMLVGPVVGLILFEGAMALDLSSLRSTSRVVAKIVVLGIPVTITLIACIAHFAIGMDWMPSILVGAILSVTGPTVITPLFKRVDVWPNIQKVLMAEGILADVLGAVLAIVVLELLIPGSSNHNNPLMLLLLRFGFGIVIGFIIGWLGVTIIRLSNLTETAPAVAITFATALIAYALPEYGLYGLLGLKEAGIISAATAGLVMGNMKYKERNECLEFKSEIVTLAISMVFVFLAASLDIETLLNIGWKGILFAIVIMLVARPIMIFLVTLGKNTISWREKLYIALTGPRGIVAASVASLAAIEITRVINESGAATTLLGGTLDLGTGNDIKALVFISIIVTVLFVSFLAKPLAKWLEVNPVKVVIVGANDIGIELAQILEKRGDKVVLIDIEKINVDTATKKGLTAVVGDASNEVDLRKAGALDAKHLVVVTSSDSKNLMIAQIAKSTFGIDDITCMISKPERMEAFARLGIKTMSPTVSAAQTLESLVHHSSAMKILVEGDSDVIADQLIVENTEIFGKQVKELSLPQEVIIAVVRREDTANIPLGDFILRKGDIATIFASREQMLVVKKLFSG